MAFIRYSDNLHMFKILVGFKCSKRGRNRVTSWAGKHSLPGKSDVTLFYGM